jgi:hypothetical protein
MQAKNKIVTSKSHLQTSGEGGIRTLGRGYLHPFSRRAHSATLAPLQTSGYCTSSMYRIKR